MQYPVNMKILLATAACVTASLTFLPLLFAQSPPENPNMLGMQSQNSGLQAVPTKGPVKIDGKLDDWDLSGKRCTGGI